MSYLCSPLNKRCGPVYARKPEWSGFPVVTDREEASKAFDLVRPGEPTNLDDFLDPVLKRFYRATPQKAWLNCLSERELTFAGASARSRLSQRNLASRLSS